MPSCQMFFFKSGAVRVTMYALPNPYCKHHLGYLRLLVRASGVGARPASQSPRSAMIKIRSIRVVSVARWIIIYLKRTENRHIYCVQDVPRYEMKLACHVASTQSSTVRAPQPDNEIIEIVHSHNFF